MAFQLLRVRQEEWFAFKKIVEAEDERSADSKKTCSQLAKDFVLRCHFSRGARREDETFRILKAVIDQARMEIDEIHHYNVDHPDGRHPPQLLSKGRE